MSGLAAAIQHEESIFQIIPVSPHDLQSLLAKGLVAAAVIFRLLTESVLQLFWAYLPATRTEPLHKTQPPLF